MLGIIDILCRGVLYFLFLKFRLYSVWDVPILFKAAIGFVQKSA